MEQQTSAPATTPVPERVVVPNNLDHITVSGLMEGSFSGPFEVDFEGNHTVLIGPEGQVTIYRARRTAPVAFIAKGSMVGFKSVPKVEKGAFVIVAEGDGCQMKVIINRLSGIVITPVDGTWLSVEKNILETVYASQDEGATVLKDTEIVAVLKGTPSIALIKHIGNITKRAPTIGRFAHDNAHGKHPKAIRTEIIRLRAEGYLARTSRGNMITPSGEVRMHALRKELGIVDLAFNA